MKNIDQFIFEKLKLNNQSKLNDTSEEDLNDPSKWKQGDILYGIWAYGMVIPYFYKILKRTPKSFTLVEIKKKLISGHYNGQFTVVPEEPHKTENKPVTARINKWGSVKLGNVILHKWNGEPLHGDDMD